MVVHQGLTAARAHELQIEEEVLKFAMQIFGTLFFAADWALPRPTLAGNTFSTEKNLAVIARALLWVGDNILAQVAEEVMLEGVDAGLPKVGLIDHHACCVHLDILMTI